MNKCKRFFIITLAFLLISFIPLDAFASNDFNDITKGTLIINELSNGEVEEIFINENREVFLNGKNITTIIPIQMKLDYDNIYSDDWKYAGVSEYHYDLGGMSVKGAVSLMNKLGLTIALSTFEAIAGSYAVNGLFDAGIYIKDLRYTYYKNINKPRPDMKEVHEFYFVVDVLNFGYYEKYLGGFTTYGGI